MTIDTQAPTESRSTRARFLSGKHVVVTGGGPGAMEAANLGALLADHPDGFKHSLADNIRAGELLSGADVAEAYTRRTALAEAMRHFFADYDVLVLPVSQVPPFPADHEYPTQINGAPMESYLDWMRSAYFITVTGCPAISVPAGTTPDGLPVGVQIVAPHGADRRLLEVAAAFEQAVAFGG